MQVASNGAEIVSRNASVDGDLDKNLQGRKALVSMPQTISPGQSLYIVDELPTNAASPALDLRHCIRHLFCLILPRRYPLLPNAG